MADAHDTRAPHTRGSVIHWARMYDFLTNAMIGRLSDVRAFALDLAGLSPGQKVLDVGCGTGTLALLAKERVGPNGEVDGIDASQQMIDRARNKAASDGVDIDFQTGVIEQLPFPDGTFDSVLSTFMLHHLPDDVKIAGFAQIARVLKPGGRLLAVDLSGDGSFIWRSFSFLIRHRMPKGYVDQLRGLVERADLSAEVLESSHGQYAFIRGTKA